MNIHSYYPRIYQVIIKSAQSALENWKGNLSGIRKRKLIFCHPYPDLEMVQFSSVAQSCLTLCDPMNRKCQASLSYHQLLESTQTHVH